MAQNNQMFSRMVENKKDVIGMIAYCSYEFHIQEYCKKIEEEERRGHTISDVNSFVSMITTYQLESYKSEARTIVNAFLNEATKKSLDNEVKRIMDYHRSQQDTILRRQKQLENEYRAKLEKYLNEAKQPGYFYGVSQGIVASFLFVLLIGIFAFILSATRYDITGATIEFVQKIFQQDSQKQSPPP